MLFELARSIVQRMKRFLIPLVLIGAIALYAAGTPKRIFLQWDNAPDYDSNVTFYIYSQTNVAMPVAGWLVLTQVDYTTWVNATNRVEVPAATATATFYVVTASNVTGESDFSSAVQVRRLPPAKNPKIGAF